MDYARNLFAEESVHFAAKGIGMAGVMNVLAPQGERSQVLVTLTVSQPASQPYGDGHAAERIVDLLLTST